MRAHLRSAGLASSGATTGRQGGGSKSLRRLRSRANEWRQAATPPVPRGARGWPRRPRGSPTWQGPRPPHSAERQPSPEEKTPRASPGIRVLRSLLGRTSCGNNAKREVDRCGREALELQPLERKVPAKRSAIRAGTLPEPARRRRRAAMHAATTARLLLTLDAWRPWRWRCRPQCRGVCVCVCTCCCMLEHEVAPHMPNYLRHPALRRSERARRGAFRWPPQPRRPRPFARRQRSTGRRCLWPGLRPPLS